MTADDLRAELEAELAWRQEDIAFFKNQLNNISDEIEKDKYRKSLVLILYSHMEGYIKIALQTYECNFLTFRPVLLFGPQGGQAPKVLARLF